MRQDFQLLQKSYQELDHPKKEERVNKSALSFKP